MEAVAVFEAHLGEQQRADADDAQGVTLVVGAFLDSVGVYVAQGLCNPLGDKLPTLPFAVGQTHPIVTLRAEDGDREVLANF